MKVKRSTLVLCAIATISLSALSGGTAESQGYRHLHSETLAPPYTNDWEGRLLGRNAAGTIDIHIKAGPKIPYAGVLRLSCRTGGFSWRSANNMGPASYAPRVEVVRKLVPAAQRVFCRNLAAAPPPGLKSRRLWNACRQRVERIGAYMDRVLCKWRNKLRNGNQPTVQRACLTNRIKTGPCAELTRCRLNTRRWSTLAMNNCRQFLSN